MSCYCLNSLSFLHRAYPKKINLNGDNKSPSYVIKFVAKGITLNLMTPLNGISKHFAMIAKQLPNPLKLDSLSFLCCLLEPHAQAQQHYHSLLYIVPKH